jgi:hypothetical protein
MEMIITDVALRERMRQIKKCRVIFEKEKKVVVLDPVSFMELANKYAGSNGKYLWCDNPACAFQGIYDIDEYETYVCPIEDLSEEELIKINNIKPKPPILPDETHDEIY